jgi:predicted HNH restriction endonuclease
MTTSAESPKHNTVYQAVEWNEAGWTRPVDRVGSGGWARKHRWAGEDWNFAFDQQVDGFIFGFGHGLPSRKRARRFGNRFNVVFYAKHPEGGAVLVGAYLDALLLVDDSVENAWQVLKKAKVIKARKAQLAAAFEDRKRAKKEVRVFKEERVVRWKVQTSNVRVLPECPVFDATGWRYRNLHFKGLPPIEELLAGIETSDEDLDGAGFISPTDCTREGRLLERVHRVRERNSEVVEAVKASRPAVCQVVACGFDFAAHYGEKAKGFIEAHHSVPLKDLDPTGGALPDPSQIVLLCANCHRAAHRTGCLTLDELNRIYRAP